MHINELAFVELYVHDAHAIADLYARTFGFRKIAQGGTETGLDGHTSIVLVQGAATLIVTSSRGSKGPVADFVRLHGDGVKDIAFVVDDAAAAFSEAVTRGAQPILPPTIVSDANGKLRCATIAGFGDVVHTFVEWMGQPRVFPRYRMLTARPWDTDEKFTEVDHIAICLEPGTLDAVAEYYKNTLDFVDGQHEYVETEISGMNARVVVHGEIKFPMQEPLPSDPQGGPIGKFLTANVGAGVYHIALHTDDIVRALRGLGDKEVDILPTPNAYYDKLPGRVGPIAERLQDLRDLGILVDRDDWGYLLQVFTRSLHERKTLFFEVIQRKEARGFGSNNVKALFEAVQADLRDSVGAIPSSRGVDAAG